MGNVDLCLKEVLLNNEVIGFNKDEVVVCYIC